MDKEALVLKETAALVQKDFEVEHIPADVTAAELLDFLERFIQDLIEHNLERLFYVLYRLDIDEQRVHQALSPYAVELPHKVLAQLIFNREQQKARTRLEYADKSYDDDVETW